MGFASNLKGERTTHVSGQTYVDAGIGKDVVGEHGGCGFTVAAGNAHHFGVGVSACEFYFGNYGYSAFDDGFHHGSCWGDARAFDHEVGVEDAFRRVGSLLPFNAFGIKHCGIPWGNGAHVGEEHLHVFIFSEDGGAHAALSSTKYYKFFSFHTVCR